MTPQLDDLEAEITYLLLRATKPAAVVELGTFHGWSTSWILSALRDNGSGHLHSFDLIDNVVRNVPAELAEGRWTFVQGDIKETVEQVPAGHRLPVRRRRAHRPVRPLVPRPPLPPGPGGQPR